MWRPGNEVDRASIALRPDDPRQQIIDKRLDFVRVENWRDGCSVRRRARRKPATDGLDEGSTVEPRLAQARTSRKFAAGAALARGTVALKASGLIPRCLTGREPCCILCESQRREGDAEPNDGGRGAAYPPPGAVATIAA